MLNNSIPLVYVIIPCHNDYFHTRLSLSSLLKSDYTNFTIIVVDDGSTDETFSQIKENYPVVKVLKGDGNLWWSGSMNLGIKEALKNYCDYVMVLNNDVLIEPSTISALVDCAKQNPNAIIGSLIYEINKPNIIWNAGGYLKWPSLGEVTIGSGEIDMGQYDGLRRVAWAPGMGTLVCKNVLRELVGYDQHYMPQYIADVDFCLRAKNAGYPTLVTSTSKIYNHVDNTGGITKDGKITWQQFKSIFTSLRSSDYLKARLMFIFRHCPWYWQIPAYIIRYTRLIVFSLRS